MKSRTRVNDSVSARVERYARAQQFDILSYREADQGSSILSLANRLGVFILTYPQERTIAIYRDSRGGCIPGGDDR